VTLGDWVVVSGNARGPYGLLSGSVENPSTEVVEPSTTVQDKIGFLLNNMQASNVNEQAAALKDILAEEVACVPWFAQYLVVKRVSLEPNFHGLYGAMLSELRLSRLQRAVLASTLQNARMLLSSDKIRSSSSQRSLLKNLGSWLGQITLARNRALLMRDLDITVNAADQLPGRYTIALSTLI
jgi:CCR4-NOT transcription complex subunit 1